MGCSSCLCKSLVGVLNTLIMLIGLTIAALGAVLQAAGGSTFFSFLESSIKNLLKSIQVGGDSFVLTIDFQKTFGPAGIILIVVGLVIACIAFLGCCGTSWGYRVLLILYAVVLGIIIIAEIVVVALFFSKALDQLIKDKLNDVLVNDYVDIDDSSLASISFNLVMLRFQCCGLDGYQDFHHAKKWNSTRTFKVQGESVTGNLTTPIACCATEGVFPNVKFLDPTTCAVFPTYNTSNWETGCWTKVTTFLNDNNVRAYAILVCVAIMIIEAVILLMAIFICRDEKSKILIGNVRQRSVERIFVNKSR